MKPVRNNVLLIMTNHHVGNFVVSLPFLQALAARFGPDVDVLVDSRFACLARLLPAVRTVIPYEQRERRGSMITQVRYFVAAIGKLWRGRYSLTVDVGGGIQSVTLTSLTMASQRVGLRKSRRSWMYTERLLSNPGVHASDRFMPFMSWIGQNEKPSIRLVPSQDARDRLEKEIPPAWLEKRNKLIVIHPGAGYAFRQWPRERFAAAADALVQRHGAQTIFIGAPGEEQALGEIIALMQNAAAARLLVTDLDVLVALYERAAVLLSNESGPTHLAAATQLPIVTIFGPSKEANWKPSREDHVTILRGQACPPECRWGNCKVGLKCIMNVSVDDMVRAADLYLGGAR